VRGRIGAALAVTRDILLPDGDSDELTSKESARGATWLVISLWDCPPVISARRR
jgi:hypothetical protein